MAVWGIGCQVDEVMAFCLMETYDDFMNDINLE
jgi:hypothetical protein